jgi:hypothetical protein
MVMSQFKTVDLGSDQLRQGSVELTTAQVLTSGGPLVIVGYTVDGHEAELGLRLDMDKGVFLDAPEETEHDLNTGRLPERTAEAIHRHLTE